MATWDTRYGYGHPPCHMVILDIDVGYHGLSIWEMTVSILSSLDVDMGYLVAL
jgi:hypothetical protein